VTGLLLPALQYQGTAGAINRGPCMAVETMKGTDAMLRRALRLVKVSRRRWHLLFDVPVAGAATIDVMRETGTTVLAVDAGRTLLLDKDEMIQRANEAGIAVGGV